MKGRALTTIGLIILCITTLSAKETWYDGVIILNDNQVLTGKISHHEDEDLIQLKQDDKIFCFSAYQVTSFNYYDTSLDAIRRFLSIPYEDEYHRFADLFFELIIDDEVSLLRKKNPYGYSTDFQTANTSYDQSSHKNDYDYFFEYKGKVIPSNRFKKDLKPLLNLTLENEISGFIKDNGLSIHRTYDQVLIVRFFNKMTEERSDQFLTSF